MTPKKEKENRTHFFLKPNLKTYNRLDTNTKRDFLQQKRFSSRLLRPYTDIIVFYITAGHYKMLAHCIQNTASNCSLLQ